MSGDLLHARYFHVVYTQRKRKLARHCEPGGGRTPHGRGRSYPLEPWTYLCCKGLKHLRVEAQVYLASKSPCSSYCGWFIPDAWPLSAWGCPK